MTPDSTWNSARFAPRAAAATAVVCLLVFAPAAIAGDEEGCLDCHGLAGLAVRDEGRRRDLGIGGRSLDASTHRELSCRECHADIVSIPHGERRVPGCGQPCHGRSAGGKEYSHEALYWQYTTSSHGSAATRRVGCLVCHPAPQQRASAGRDKVAEARLCASCHRGNARVVAWFSDRHFLALASGNARAPSCPDCHGSHRIRPRSAAESTVHPARLAETCAKGAVGGGGDCHGALGAAAVAGVSMNPLPRGAGAAGALRLLMALAPAVLAAGLVVRAGVGLARGR